MRVGCECARDVIQFRQHRQCVGWSVLRRLGETVLHQVRECRRDVGVQFMQRLRNARELRRHRGGRRRRRKRRDAAQQLIREQADGVDVHAMVRFGIRRQLLRRHVGRCADRHPRRGVSRSTHRQCGVERLGHTEVGHQRVASVGEDIAWLDVAMDYAARMRVGQRLDHVVQQLEDFRQLERAGALQSGTQRLAGDVRHREPQQLVVLTGVQ